MVTDFITNLKNKLFLSDEEKINNLKQDKEKLERKELISKMQKENTQIKKRIREDKREEFLNSPIGRNLTMMKNKLKEKGDKQKKSGNKFVKNFRL